MGIGWIRVVRVDEEMITRIVIVQKDKRIRVSSCVKRTIAPGIGGPRAYCCAGDRDNRDR